MDGTNHAGNHPDIPIYLDYQATTPVDPRVLEAMLPWFNAQFGNPHSRSHFFGWRAEEAVEQARSKIAKVIGADPREIIFTSGATEANNLALKGVAEFNRERGNHIITVQTEHKCVLDSCRHLEMSGFEVTYLPVRPDGRLDPGVFRQAVRPGETILASVMLANNEIGTIQPIAEIGEICREHNILFHTDAAQAVGKIPVDVEAMHIDLLSISGHKIYGPMGVGALYVRRRQPRVRLRALINGGGQERGMRSGTLPLPLCVGLGEAAAFAHQEMEAESVRLAGLRDRMQQELFEALPEIFLNGSEDHRLPGNLNISFAHVEGEGLMMRIKNLAVSSGSACTSASLEPSYVLRALGVTEELAHTSLRIGFGRFTTSEEVDEATRSIIDAVNRLREMSPLWEMSRQGIDISQIEWAAH